MDIRGISEVDGRRNGAEDEVEIRVVQIVRQGSGVAQNVLRYQPIDDG